MAASVQRQQVDEPYSLAAARRDLHVNQRTETDHFNGLRVYVVDQDARNFEDHWHLRKGGDAPTFGDPTPAGRDAPSRFDAYTEPIWKRLYWAVRVVARSVAKRRALARQISERPDLAAVLQDEQVRFQGRHLWALVSEQLRK